MIFDERQVINMHFIMKKTTSMKSKTTLKPQQSMLDLFYPLFYKKVVLFFPVHYSQPGDRWFQLYPLEFEIRMQLVFDCYPYEAFICFS